MRRLLYALIAYVESKRDIPWDLACLRGPVTFIVWSEDFNGRQN